MSEQNSQVNIDSALCGYMEELVTAKVAESIDAVRAEVEQLSRKIQSSAPKTSNRAAIVVFSGEMDKLLAAFIIATGAACMEMEVSMYFAFWGLTALKKKTIFKGKSTMEKLIGAVLPSCPGRAGTSKMNMLGIGPVFLKCLMRKKNVVSLAELIGEAKELGVRLMACQMSMNVMGIKKEELIDGLDYVGVGTYIADASDSRITLFI